MLLLAVEEVFLFLGDWSCVHLYLQKNQELAECIIIS